MNKNEKYSEESKVITKEDLSSIASTKKPYAFRVETTKPVAQSMTVSEIILALYSGVLKSDEVTLNFIELNSGKDVDFKNTSALSVQGVCESVTVVCDSLTTCVDGVSSVEPIQTSVNGEGLSC